MKRRRTLPLAKRSRKKKRHSHLHLVKRSRKRNMHSHLHLAKRSRKKNRHRHLHLVKRSRKRNRHRHLHLVKRSRKKEQAQPPAPCQKEQPGTKELGPSIKQEAKDKDKGDRRKENSPCQKGVHRVSISPESDSSDTAQDTKRAKQPEAPCQKEASSSRNHGYPARNWLKDGHRWITKAEAKKGIAMDYHNTLSKGNGNQVHWMDKNALRILKKHGYYLILLSYCGQKRSEQVLKEVEEQDMMKYFDKIRFTWKRTGEEGKAVYCLENHIPVLFDDSKEILDECSDLGIYTYNINTKHCVHTAGHWHFWQAVDQFLTDQNEDIY